MTKTRQWAVFTAVAVLAVFALGWLLLISPQRSKAADLKSQAAGQQMTIASLHTQLSQLLAEKKDLPDQERTLGEIANKIPSDSAEPTLIRQLRTAATTADVDLSSLAPSAAQPVIASPTAGSSASTLYAIPVAFTVSGSYANCELFLYRLEKLPRAMLISGLSIAPSNTGTAAGATANPGSTADVTATITATVFSTSPTAVSPLLQPSTGPSADTTAPATAPSAAVASPTTASTPASTSVAAQPAGSSANSSAE
jgi:Tfp pilus assembly protein PilO